MSFASPHRETPRTSRTGAASLRSHSPPLSQRQPYAPVNEDFYPQQSYLWPSETDPHRAHWLRNEVIAFERVLHVLREERDVAVEQLKREEQIGAQLADAEGIAAAAVEKKECKRKELLEQNEEMRREIQEDELHLQQLEAERNQLTFVVYDLRADQSKAETEHRNAKYRVKEQLDMQGKMEDTCADIQTQLANLRDHPKVPKEYAEHVERMKEAHDARIASLQEEIHRLMPDIEDLESDNKSTEKQLEEFEQQTAAAERAVADATAKLKSHSATKEQEYAELEQLQQIYYNLPEKVEEQTITREVTREVNREIMFN